MAGPRVMALGPFQFETYGFGFQSRRKTSDTPWAELEIAGGENVLQWTGPKPRTEAIRGVVFKAFGGQRTLEAMKLAARNGVPLPFVDLGGFPSNILGMHVIEGITEDHTFIDATGAPLRNAYTITVRSFSGSLAMLGTIPVLSLFS